MKDIAEATKQDSSTMLTIAILTTLFLPPTYIAVRFSEFGYRTLVLSCSLDSLQHKLLQLPGCGWPADCLEVDMDLRAHFSCLDGNGPGSLGAVCEEREPDVSGRACLLTFVDQGRRG